MRSTLRCNSQAEAAQSACHERPLLAGCSETKPPRDSLLRDSLLRLIAPDLMRTAPAKARILGAEYELKAEHGQGKAGGESGSESVAEFIGIRSQRHTLPNVTSGCAHRGIGGVKGHPVKMLARERRHTANSEGRLGAARRRFAAKTNGLERGTCGRTRLTRSGGLADLGVEVFH